VGYARQKSSPENTKTNLTAKSCDIPLFSGVNFINVLRAAFTRADPESVIIQSNPQYLLRFLDLRVQKLLFRMLIKLTPGVGSM